MKDGPLLAIQKPQAKKITIEKIGERAKIERQARPDLL